MPRYLLILLAFALCLGVATAEPAKPPKDLFMPTKDEVRAWQIQAPEGDAVAQFWLGKSYLQGWHLTPDRQSAFDWFKRSADQDYPEGLNALAVCYQNGLGIQKDEVRAANILAPLAENGNALAQYNYGIALLQGIGVAVDPEMARGWLEKAAAQNNADAMCTLASIHARGIGVEPDPKLSFQWYEKAAALDHPQGYYGIARAYELGTVTDQRPDKALENYQKAADYGNAKAMTALSYLYAEKDPAQGFYWLEEAAEAGDPQAEFLLGGSYFHGENIKRDLKEARKWLQRAHDHGHPDAKQYLDRIPAPRRGR